ncbi:MAG: hypothetical protein Aurels2KO_56800 [Aureliella sp.]
MWPVSCRIREGQFPDIDIFVDKAIQILVEVVKRYRRKFGLKQSSAFRIHQDGLVQIVLDV